MTATSLRRLAGMAPGELRFRASCELRKGAARLRSRVSAPRWERRDLLRRLHRSPGSAALSVAVDALRRGDDLAAHRALADHFTRRTSVFPVGAGRLEGLAEAIRRDFPNAAAQAAAQGDRLIEGRYDLLGYKGLQVGGDPDWHRDPVHGRTSPRVFWADVPYLDPAHGDHKVLWELNRHQHWMVLGRAHVLTGDRRYRDAFAAQLASWLRANPPLVGTNWSSMLELGFRTLSWIWALELFAASARDDREPWLVDLLLGLDRQLAHIEQNLSYYFSPNTHLTGEALALYVAGRCLPELRDSARRASVGRAVLIREASRQILPDGGHAELSPHYHRYSTDFYLLAALVARRAQDGAASTFDRAARAQASFLRLITERAGFRPQIGDDDGGQLFGMCGRPPEDCRDTLATAAVLLDEPALAVGPVPEETYWLCGPATLPDVDNTETCWSSAALPSSGYFVSRTPRGDHLVFDAGRHGYLNGGHAHADALSCTLAVAGRPLLIDPGTATYTMGAAVRDRFRRSSMHNTVALDGRSQAEPNGPFHWKSTVDAHASIWQASPGCDYAEGTHEAYRPMRHTRAVLAIHGLGWWIVDHVLGDGTATIEQYWHVAPSWRCSLASPHVCAIEDGDRIALASSSPLTVLQPGSHPLAERSPAYGIIEPAPVIRAETRAPTPATVVTFVPAAPQIAEELQLERVALDSSPGPGWHGQAFEMRWRRGAMTLVAAVERSGLAEHDRAAPPGRWGTAGLHTDARLAVLVDRPGTPPEVIMVNGSIVTAGSDRTLELPARVPLARMVVPIVASGVQEVGAAIQP